MKFMYHEIELTRRCNLKCSHCMRGDMQPVDIKEEDLISFWLRTTHIETLTLTGGEVSLVPHLLNMCIEQIKLFGTEIRHVGIITNGRAITDKFLTACRKWRKDISSLAVSVSIDEYHKEVTQKNAERLHSIRAGRRQRTTPVVPVGRALTLDPSFVNQGAFRFHPHWIANGWIMEPTYLNALGNYVNADTSYIEQEEYTIGHVTDVDENSFLQSEGFRVAPGTGATNGNHDPFDLVRVCKKGPAGVTVLHDDVVGKEMFLSELEMVAA